MKNPLNTSSIFYMILTMMIIFTNPTFAFYSRDNAWQYLKLNILGSASDTCSSYGSDTTVSPETLILDYIISPTYECWMFLVDFNPHLAWCHDATLYFIDINNPGNYTEHDVDQFPDVPMEEIQVFLWERLDVGMQGGENIAYPDPDPSLKAIMVVAGMEFCWYNNLSRFYVMLKHLGYGDIRVYYRWGLDRDVSVGKWAFVNGAWDCDAYIPPHNFDLDNDGVDDIIGPAFIADVTQGFQSLANDTGPDDRVFVYLGNHGFCPTDRISGNVIGYYGQMLMDESDDPLSADELYDLLEPLNNVAELFVINESCHGAGMFEAPSCVNRYRDNFPNGHFVAACRKDQEVPFENDYSMYVYLDFGYIFTTGILGHFPYIYDLHGDGNINLYTNTDPWRQGEVLSWPAAENRNEGRTLHEDFGGQCYDTWDLTNDRNNDEMTSFREAIEFAWAYCNYASAITDPPNQHTRYRDPIIGRGRPVSVYDPFYFWQGYNTPYCPENDSSGTVCFTGRGGILNWKSGGQVNWSSDHNYIFTHDLIIPAMDNAPTTTLGNQQHTVNLKFYPGTSLIIERQIEDIVNVHFDAADASDDWGGIAIEDQDLTFEDCIISEASTGIEAINSSVVITGTHFIDCYLGVYAKKTSGFDIENVSFSNSICDYCQEGIYIDGPKINLTMNNGSEIFGGIFGLDLWDSRCVDITGSSFHDNWCAIYSYGTMSGLTLTDCSIFENDFGAFSTGSDFYTILGSEFYDNNLDGIHTTGDNNIIIAIAQQEHPDNTVNNSFYGNNCGMYIDSYSTFPWIDLGDETWTEPGWNQFYNNIVDLDNDYASLVTAEMNFWGEAPPNPAHIRGNVDYNPYWDGNDFTPQNRGDDVINDGDQDDIQQLLGMFTEYNDDELIAFCRRIISEDPSSRNASIALNLWYRSAMRCENALDRRYDIDDFVYNRFRNTVLHQWNRFYCAGIDARFGDEEAAIREIRAITNEREYDDNLKLAALWKLANLYEVQLEDCNEASRIYEEILRNYDDSGYAAIAEVRLRRLEDAPERNSPDRPAINQQVPDDFAINTIYPNPFNSLTRVSYALPEAGKITISIFDIHGRIVQTLFNGTQEAGYQSLTWDANGVSSGIYIVRMNAGQTGLSRKVLLAR